MKKFFCSCLFLALSLLGQEEPCLIPPALRLFDDLETVHRVNQHIQDELPLLINYLGQGGYFCMPSARTFTSGQIGLGFSYAPPYRIWGLGFQFFDHIETTANYWVFSGVLDQNFGGLGFGEEAERSPNIKFIVLGKKDGFSFLPEFALGWNDFFGTKRFSSFYFAGTKELLDWNLETTLGWGRGRIHGFFGALAWTPFRKQQHCLKNLTAVAEYDANDYEHHPHEHPEGNRAKSRINAGLQWTLYDVFRISASSLRGEKWAAGVDFHYNLGASEGLFPKIYDPSFYTAPVDHHPLGRLREDREFAQQIAYAFKEQGFDLYDLYLVPQKGGSESLWMKVVNVRYWEKSAVRARLERLLSGLMPSNIRSVTTVIEDEGLPVYEYCFRREDLRRYAENRLGEAEFSILSPALEAGLEPNRYEASRLYRREKPIWLLTFRPWMRSFLGSSSGKFKYEVGIGLGPEGYLLDQVYYNLWATYTVHSSIAHLMAQDSLNPSYLINVRTDAILYNQAHSFHVDQAYLQKSWNLGHGWFSRIALGYFETAYGGVACESLYFPVGSSWALGVEGAALWKRQYYGLGFRSTIRKLTNEGPIYVPYTGFQYFLNFYYDYKPLQLDFKVGAGQFLAWDKGARFEGGRTFSSGLRVGLWYTYTNAQDLLNQKRYYDKGISITMPLEIFMNKSSRTRIGYSMAAWLRDCGAVSGTGKPLYSTLFWSRYTGKPHFD